MSQQDTNSALNDVRAILTELMATEGHNKFMHAQLTISLKTVNAMISFYNAGKAARDNIKLRSSQKTR